MYPLPYPHKVATSDNELHRTDQVILPRGEDDIAPGVVSVTSTKLRPRMRLSILPGGAKVGYDIELDGNAALALARHLTAADETYSSAIIKAQS